MKTDTSVVIAGCLFLALGVVAIIAIGAIVNGFVLATLWSWFVVATFGLPVLSVPQAMGIGLTVSFLTVRASDIQSSGNKDRALGALLSQLVFSPILTLGMGWIILQFI